MVNLSVSMVLTKRLDVFLDTGRLFLTQLYVTKQFTDIFDHFQFRDKKMSEKGQKVK